MNLVVIAVVVMETDVTIQEDADIALVLDESVVLAFHFPTASG